MGAVKVPLTLPPKKNPKKAAKEIVHSMKSKSYEPKQPTSKAQTKKAGKGQKHSFTVDGTWSGDERDGLPTVDPRQGKKFTRAGRKKSGRKTKQTSTRGRRANRQLSLQEEVDTPVLFDIPENARVLPTRAQLTAAAEAGYAGDLPADFPDVDEEVLPTDLVGEEYVEPIGPGAVPAQFVETHDVRITTKLGKHAPHSSIANLSQGWVTCILVWFWNNLFLSACMQE